LLGIGNKKKTWPSQVFLSERLEADEFQFKTGVVNRPPENFLAAGADVRDVDAEHFQAIFELFEGEVVLVQHDVSPFR
jgi:hypothetical protein